MSTTFRCTILALATMLAAPVAAADADAEYAARWSPDAGGGLTSVDAVLAALGLKGGKTRAYSVRYFEAPPATALPAGYKASMRERRGDEVETTFKIRGSRGDVSGLAGLACPFKGKVKREVDVLVTEAGTKTADSFSCSTDRAIEKVVAPTPKAVGCTTRVLRAKAHDVKVEEWTFPGGHRLFDVSWKATTSAGDLGSFRDRVVRPLLQRRVVLLDTAKTELGSDCDRAATNGAGTKTP